MAAASVITRVHCCRLKHAVRRTKEQCQLHGRSWARLLDGRQASQILHDRVPHFAQCAVQITSLDGTSGCHPGSMQHWITLIENLREGQGVYSCSQPTAPSQPGPNRRQHAAHRRPRPADATDRAAGPPTANSLILQALRHQQIGRLASRRA